MSEEQEKLAALYHQMRLTDDRCRALDRLAVEVAKFFGVVQGMDILAKQQGVAGLPDDPRFRDALARMEAEYETVKRIDREREGARRNEQAGEGDSEQRAE